MAGFGIAWGLFLLVVFLGIGNGFKDGVMKMFNAYAQKSLFVYGGRTSSAGGFMNENTQVVFGQDIIDRLRSRYGSIISISPELSSAPMLVSYDGEASSISVNGVDSDYFNIKILSVKEGRAFNRMDDLYARNVVILGDGVRQNLFGEQSGIGREINIGGSLFNVVGVLSSEDLFTMQERGSVYVPASAFVREFDTEGNIPSFCLSLSQEIDSKEVEKDLGGYLAFRYGFDPHDDQALYIANIETQTAAFESLFHGLEVLIWLVGLCLLLSGIVGVCNVMLIIVKERTNEIGIRKAVGATSSSIISMILTESIAVTFISGMVGFILGACAVKLLDSIVLPMLNAEIMDSLRINIPAAIVALVILCLSGVMAGLFPALKASQITPVDAIRYENRE